jgi:hypothetical protein
MFESKLSFSKSEKYKSYSESTSRTQTVTYEAKAICTEFVLSLGKRVIRIDKSRLLTSKEQDSDAHFPLCLFNQILTITLRSILPFSAPSIRCL